MKSTTLTLWLALTASTAAWSQERAEFKGVPLGSTRAEFLEKNPLFACRSATSCSLYGTKPDGHCAILRYEGTEKARALSKPECVAAARKAGTYANQPAYLLATFRNEILSQGAALIDPDAFGSIVEAIAARHGAAQWTKNETLQNRAGAKFENQIMRWTIGGDTITARKYSSTVTQGIIDVVDQQSTAEMKEKLENNRKTAPSDL